MDLKASAMNIEHTSSVLETIKSARKMQNVLNLANKKRFPTLKKKVVEDGRVHTPDS